MKLSTQVAPMECLVPPNFVKPFAKVLFCLSRFGDYVTVVPGPSGLKMKLTNSAKTCFASVFLCDPFIEDYQTDGREYSCKISIKAMAAIFRNLNIIEKFNLRLDPLENRFIMEAECKRGVMKTFSLSYEDKALGTARFRKDAQEQKVSMRPKLLQECLAKFDSSTEEITLGLSPTSMKLKSYVSEGAAIQRMVRTELEISGNEFNDVIVLGDYADISFALKELKAIGTFSESCAQEVTLYFSGPSEGNPSPPLIANVHIDTAPDCVLDFLIACVIDADATQTTTGGSGHIPSRTPTAPSRSRASMWTNITNFTNTPSGSQHISSFTPTQAARSNRSGNRTVAPARPSEAPRPSPSPIGGTPVSAKRPLAQSKLPSSSHLQLESSPVRPPIDETNESFGQHALDTPFADDDDDDDEVQPTPQPLEKKMRSNGDDASMFDF